MDSKEKQFKLNLINGAIGDYNSNSYLPSLDWQIDYIYKKIVANGPSTSNFSFYAPYGNSNPNTNWSLDNYKSRFGNVKDFEEGTENINGNYYYDGSSPATVNSFYECHYYTVTPKGSTLAYLYSLSEDAAKVTQIETKLNNEITRATQKESELSENIIQLSENIVSEKNRATEVENTLRKDLDSEISRAKESENSLDSKKLNRKGKNSITINGVTDTTNDWDDNGTEGSNNAITSDTFAKAIKDLDKKKVNRYYAPSDYAGEGNPDYEDDAGNKFWLASKIKVDGNDRTSDSDWDDEATFKSTKAVTSNGVIKYIRKIMQWSKNIITLDSEKYGCICFPFSTSENDVMELTLILEKELIELSVTPQGVFGCRNTDAAPTNLWYLMDGSKCYIFVKTKYTTKIFIKSEGLIDRTNDAVYLERESDIAVTETETMPNNVIAVSLKN